jgi:MSHA biogenesis protein MshG
MAIYKWRGRNALGEVVTGQLEAMSEGGVVKQLKALDVMPVHIAISAETTTASADSWLVRADRWLVKATQEAVVVEDVVVFSRQMYSLDKAGVPILRALAGLQASAVKPVMTEILQDIRSSLEQGHELSVALARHDDVFSAFYIAMIKTGEMTGRLTEVFLRLNEYLVFERDVRERIKQAMRYPSFVIGAMAVAMLVVTTFVIPIFARVYDGYDAELPAITRGLLAFSSGILNWWPVLVAFIRGGGLLARGYVRTPEGLYRWDALKIKFPFVGNIILKATLARFANSFALIGESGVPLVQALTVVAKTVDNAFIGRRIQEMRDGIERGRSIAYCAANTGIFTPVVIQMITVGEETGELNELLIEIAGMYERETDYSIKGLATAIEPLLIVFIGILVLLLALGVYLPIWNLSDAVMGRG